MRSNPSQLSRSDARAISQQLTAIQQRLDNIKSGRARHARRTPSGSWLRLAAARGKVLAAAPIIVVYEWLREHSRQTVAIAGASAIAGAITATPQVIEHVYPELPRPDITVIEKVPPADPPDSEPIIRIVDVPAESPPEPTAEPTPAPTAEPTEPPPEDDEPVVTVAEVKPEPEPAPASTPMAQPPITQPEPEPDPAPTPTVQPSAQPSPEPQPEPTTQPKTGTESGPVSPPAAPPVQDQQIAEPSPEPEPEPLMEMQSFVIELPRVFAELLLEMFVPEPKPETEDSVVVVAAL